MIKQERFALIRHGFKNKQIKSAHHCGDHYIILSQESKRDKCSSVIRANVSGHETEKFQFGSF